MPQNDNSTKPAFLIIGDAMLDVYHVGTAMRLAAEAPIPVIRCQDEPLTILGGAGNVAANISSLGGQPIMWSADNQRMPIKHRVICNNAIICRFDYRDYCEELTGDAITAVIDEHEPSAFIISDYNKGTIGTSALAVINALPPEKLYIDTKRSPTTYPQDATFFPNRDEHAEFWREYASCSRIVLKKGSEGAQLLEGSQVIDECPALSHSIINVTGAGDTVIAAFTICETMNLHPNPLFFAMAAASIAVEGPLTSAPLLEAVQERLQRPQSFDEIRANHEEVPNDD